MEELKILSARLAALLSDPQPGLFMWRSALNDVLVRLSDFIGKEGE